MSDVKLNKQVELQATYVRTEIGREHLINKTFDVAFYDPMHGECWLDDHGCEVGLDLVDITVKQQWVKIEDAELVDGEEYRFHTIHGEVELGTWGEVGFYNHDTKTFKDVWMMESLYTSNGHTIDTITHVIHLPKPTHPSPMVRMV